MGDPGAVGRRGRGQPGLSAIGALAFLLLLPTVAGVVLARPAGAQEADGLDPSLELAQRYAPIVAIRTPDTLCGEGEPHAPAAVESVLGRDDVALVGPDGQVVTTAPTAADLFGLGEGYHVDLPGNHLDPGCTYATWWWLCSGPSSAPCCCSPPAPASAW